MGNQAGKAEVFLLLQPPDLTAYLRKLTNTSLPLPQAQAISLIEMQNLYYSRLNSLVSLPLHPCWTEQLWQRALENGEIEHLECTGIEAYLCRKPADELLRQEVSELIRLGKLAS